MAEKGKTSKGKSYPVPKARAPQAESSNKSEKEAAAFALGLDLHDKKTEVQLNQIGRDDSLDKHLHFAIILVLYLILALAALSVVFIFVHMTNIIRWMTDEQVRDLTEMLTTGAVGGVIATVARSRLSAIERKKD